MQAVRRKPNASSVSAPPRKLHSAMESFSEFGRKTRCSRMSVVKGTSIPVYTNEFWTSKQRAAHPIHEISYRACFKPQLPGFFIERFSKPEEIVYDPFAGRGTTLIEAAIRGRIPYGCDVNPLSELLILPRIATPSIEEVEARLEQLPATKEKSIPESLKGLLVFFHRKTLLDLCALRSYLLKRKAQGKLDSADRWIWMVALNRLTGHSPGFFSGYTLPPNQAVSVASQRKINQRLGQRPEQKNIAELILRKSRGLLRGMESVPEKGAKKAKLFISSADSVRGIKSGSVQLVVTSPPFLDVVDYVSDNWVRAWFAGVDLSKISVWQFRKIEEWKSAMARVFDELERVLRPGGYVAFEVGEVRNGKVKLEESIAEVGHASGLEPLFVLVNEQNFTKTSNCWGVSNQKKGTNTNRVVVFRKSA